MTKVLIHALGADMGGGVRHLTNFLPELGMHDKSREYVVLVRKSFSSIEIMGNIRLERIPDRECSAWLNRIARDVFNLPARLRREKFSAVVSLTNFGPIWSPIPHIIFQRNPLYYCRCYLERVRGHLKLETLLRRRLAVESMKRADLIVTPSRTMSEMIREVCPSVKGGHFRTLYHGFDMGNSYSGTEIILPPQADNAHPLLFYPSHLGEYKGFRILFDAVRILKERFPAVKLVLTIGQEDNRELFCSYQRYLEKLGIHESVLMIGRVAQDSIASLYKRADLMIYPSLCESFGFSMLEAMGTHVPIVAADTPLNHEICQSAAIYYPPLNPKACAEVVASLIEDDSARDKLRSEGTRRLSSYDWSWSRYAGQFKSLVEELVS